MQLTYRSHHRWLCRLGDSPLAHFSKTVQKRLLHALAHVESHAISYKIEPINEHFFMEFVPLYTKEIQERPNGVVHDVYTKTMVEPPTTSPYFTLSMYEGASFVGGALFSLRDDRVGYAYRAFHKKWSTDALRISPAVLAEYAVAEFALRNDRVFISHGRDRNPYGKNAAIGLAIYKLSVGCIPKVEEKNSIEVCDTASFTEDVLLLEDPGPHSDTITKAYLIAAEDTLHKYDQVTKYPDQLAVEIILRS
ncbi:MAG TPA: hypothetical protein VGE31_01770 [Candidatus Paceibacterota bacterium]